VSGIVTAVASSVMHTLSKPTAPSIRLLAGLGVAGDAHMGERVKHRSRVARDPTQPNLRQFHHEWHDDSGSWYRAHGNEQWEFDAAGLMRRREASINDVPIREADRLFHWPLGPRPSDHPGLTQLGL
jgi:hypothetical protein